MQDKIKIIIIIIGEATYLAASQIRGQCTLPFNTLESRRIMGYFFKFFPSLFLLKILPVISSFKYGEGHFGKRTELRSFSDIQRCRDRCLSISQAGESVLSRCVSKVFGLGNNESNISSPSHPS